MRAPALFLFWLGAGACCGGARSSDPPGAARPSPTPAEPGQPGERPVPPTTDAPLADLEGLVRSLPEMLRGAADDAALAALADQVAAVPGVKSATLGKPGWGHHIAIEPMDAARVAAILGLADPHIVSTDVHQHGWSIVARTGATTTDPHGRRRIDAQPPSYGVWKLRISVEGRPPGPLPGLSWGPSPAYPLAGAGARVTGFGLYPVR